MRVVSPGAILPAPLHDRDHVDADTVLYAGDRIEEFELGEKIGLDALFPGDLLDDAPAAYRRSSR